MITRQAYLENMSDSPETRVAGRTSAHRAYYAQFVNEPVKQLVLRNIGMKRIVASTDPHFNDIRLECWDVLVQMLPRSCVELMHDCGDYLTLAGGVCILKEAARQLLEARPK